MNVEIKNGTLFINDAALYDEARKYAEQFIQVIICDEGSDMIEIKINRIGKVFKHPIQSRSKK